MDFSEAKMHASQASGRLRSQNSHPWQPSGSTIPTPKQIPTLEIAHTLCHVPTPSCGTEETNPGQAVSHTLNVEQTFQRTGQGVCFCTAQDQHLCTCKWLCPTQHCVRSNEREQQALVPFNTHNMQSTLDTHRALKSDVRVHRSILAGRVVAD